MLDLRRPEAQDWFFRFFRAGDGAVRVVAVDAERIEVTDYLSQEKIKAESKSIELVFPRFSFTKQLTHSAIYADHPQTSKIGLS